MSRSKATALTVLIMASLLGGLYVLVAWPLTAIYVVCVGFFLAFGVVTYLNLRSKADR